jgi:hypothetical protein
MSPGIARAEWPDTESVQMFRAMTSEDRLRVGFGMWESARSMLFNLLSNSHPDWDDHRLMQEVARRLSNESG